MLFGLESVSKESVGVRVSRSKCVAWVHLPKPQRTGDPSPSRPSAASNEPWGLDSELKSAQKLTRLHSNAAALCSSRWRKQCVHLLLLKMFGENLRHSKLRLPIVSNFLHFTHNSKGADRSMITTQRKNQKYFLFFDSAGIFSLSSLVVVGGYFFTAPKQKPAKKLQPIESKIKPHLTEIERN